MRIGVITAMSSEHRQLAEQLKDKKETMCGGRMYTEGRVGKNTIILTECGIGKVNAAVGAVELIHRFEPDCVISTGVAGGIDSMLRVMDVVVSREIVYHDVWCGEGNEYGQVQGMPARYSGDARLVACACALQTESRIHGGLICSGDKFITSRPELDEIKHNFPEGLAVDMESGAIAHTCFLYKVPFLSFRIISDTPGVDNHTQQYQDFWGEMANRSFRVTETFLQALPETL